MNRRRVRIIAIVSAFVAAVLALWVFDPEGEAWMPRCWWHALTGLQCPACGTLRAAHAALNGSFGQAWRFNYMLPFYLPLAAAVVALLAWRPRSRWIAPLALSLAALLLLWMIVRNLLGC